VDGSPEGIHVMKGIILTAGHGTRLRPLTKVTSKQLLPVYDKPLIFYPLDTLLKAGIREILFIVSPDHAGDFLKLLGSGKDFGAKFVYEIQDKPEGIAQAYIIGEPFIGEENVALILGDNIFLDDFSASIKAFKSGALAFAKEVPDPERFGVVKFDETGKAAEIKEKPQEFLSEYALTGLYVTDNKAIEIAKGLQPSARGELEITDGVLRAYLQKNELSVEIVKDEWIDAGTFESLFRASELMRNRKLNQK
jgi:glucose-1-phosphate thymidylyltransferase